MCNAFNICSSAYSLVFLQSRACIILIALEQSTTTHGVVSIHTGSGAWGTGVLANDDIVITCAHVIQKERGITYLI